MKSLRSLTDFFLFLFFVFLPRVGVSRPSLERPLVQPDRYPVPRLKPMDEALSKHGEAPVGAVQFTVVQVHHVRAVHVDLNLDFLYKKFHAWGE